jgi:hypothetical protein
VWSSAGIRLAGCEPLRNRPAADRSGLLGIEARPLCRLELHCAQDRPSSCDQLGRDRRRDRLDQLVVGVVGTDIARSRTSEVSFRSVDSGRMLDQSRWHRHCPGFCARRGPSSGPDGQQAPSDGRSDRCGARECHRAGRSGVRRVPDRFRVRVRSPGRSQAAFRTMPPNTPRAAGRGAAGGDARRRRRLRCYAQRDFGPPGGGRWC